MTIRTGTDRAFWQGVLLAGGPTSIPRWTLAPHPGVAEHREPLGADLDAALRRIAAELVVPLGTVVLAAHARVLAALTGEADVVTGYRMASAEPTLPCRLTTEAASWRDLMADVRGVETELLAHAGYPVEALREELALPAPFETVFDLAGADSDPDDGVVLVVGLVQGAEASELVLRYRTEALDEGAAARLAGYHVAALAAMAADPDAKPGRVSLLSAEERHLQLHGLAGPARALPDRRFHELFEERVLAAPDVVAAVHRGEALTYRELDERAARIARALLARGLRREGVVAVVTERDLDWMAAVIAVMRAGGAYLPIDPAFPSDRIATMLARAGCELVLVGSGDIATLEAATASQPGIVTLPIATAMSEAHPDVELDVAVTSDQLAYIYFTSGSTGEPKGAMCEHAGMLNHLLAKLEDLGIGPGDVVAQTAPSTFDISLWQLLSGLLVGGRTLIVEHEVILDARRFLDAAAQERVRVLQVVPSYLEVLIAALEREPRILPDLRFVSVTGEALTAELARRWFAVQPRIPLVNAYGLTETSDDTNHEIIRGMPDGGRVALGRPVRNAHVYVVDEALEPVPLGAPGEIVFSGVCVGRGYVNDAERTQAAFMPDPHRPAERLYRSGDHGRWLPDGKLEFIGRRDGQVKVAGFRIELGEVESAFARVPDIRQAAVVVAGTTGQARQLVAFIVAADGAAEALDADALRDAVAERLPTYMIPANVHHLDALPLSGSGKVDRKRLVALADELDDRGANESDGQRPSTPTEGRLAAAWATALGVPEEHIARGDDFFDRGGTSLAAVKLVLTLDGAISLQDVTRTPVLADLAALVDARAAAPIPANGAVETAEAA